MRGRIAEPPAWIAVLENLDDLVHDGESGVDDFLCWPVDADELRRRIILADRRRCRLLALRSEARAYQQDASQDYRTELFNDRYFFQRLEEELQRIRRHHKPLALILVDCDDFKSVNDRHGHPVGDRVLAEFGRKLRTITRQIDIGARLGGDEFALLLPDTDLDEASKLAARLREEMGNTEFEEDGAKFRVTLSIGIHGSLDGEDLDPKAFYRRADAALLRAKRRGKNRICLSVEREDSATAGR